MLVRAATRRVPRDVLRNNIRPPTTSSLLDQSISFPWLYQTQSLQSPFQRNSSSTTVSSSSRLFQKPSEKHVDATRHFQTNAAVLPDQGLDDGISIYGNQPIGAMPKKPASLDPSLVILDVPEPPRRVDTHAGHTMLVEKADIISHYHVCVKAGRLQRAQLVLEGLHKAPDATPSELTAAHNAFLDALLEKALADKDQVRLFFMWYEERMKAKWNVPVNADTIALLFKGSLLVAEEATGLIYLKHYYRLALTIVGHSGRRL